MNGCERKFLGASFISTTAGWLMFTAVSWLAYQETQDAIYAAGIVLLWAIPSFLVSLTTMSLTARLSRKGTIVVANVLHVVIATAAAILALTGTIEFWYLAATQVLAGIVGGFETPASNAYMADLVSKESQRHNDGIATRRETSFATGRFVALSIALGFLLIAGDPNEDAAMLIVGLAFVFLAISHLVVVFLIRGTKPKSREINAESLVIVAKKTFAMVTTGTPEIKGLLLLKFFQLVFGTTFFLLFPWLKDSAGVDLNGPNYLWLRFAGVGGAALCCWVFMLTRCHLSSWSKSLRLVYLLFGIGFVIQITYPLLESFLVAMIIYPLAWAIEAIAVVAVIRRFQDLEGEKNKGDKFVAQHTLETMGMICWAGTSMLPQALGPLWAIPALGIAGLLSLAAMVGIFWHHIMKR